MRGPSQTCVELSELLLIGCSLTNMDRVH